MIPEGVDLTGCRVLIGLTGGIAVYKMAGVVSALAQRGCGVTVAMTDAATRFVAPLTFQSLSGRAVLTSIWEDDHQADPQHIRLARDAQLMLLAPCSMNMLGKLAQGRCDEVVSLLVAAIDREKTPVLLAPSMNATMWNQPATQRNIALLRTDGFEIIQPASGWQACRTEGPGRLPEPEELCRVVVERLQVPQ